MENAESFNDFLKQFYVAYQKTVFAVDKLRATPILRTCGMLKNCLQLIDETCSRIKEMELKWGRQDFIPQWMALDGMMKHLNNLREEICNFQTEAETQNSIGELSFKCLVEFYNKTIAYARQATLKAVTRNEECVVISIRMIDNFCTKRIKLFLNDEQFKILWTSFCGMVEHLQNVMNGFFKLETMVPIFTRIKQWIPFVIHVAVNLILQFGSPAMKTYANFFNRMRPMLKI